MGEARTFLDTPISAPLTSRMMLGEACGTCSRQPPLVSRLRISLPADGEDHSATQEH